jgi:hypothetical protein
MINKMRSLSWRQIVILTLILLLIISLLIILALPEKQTGPFGIGLPTDFSVFTSKSGSFIIKYPESWVARETPQGSHGDKEVFAVILVPGRSFPQVYFAYQQLVSNDMDTVVKWGKERATARSHYSEISVSAIATPNVEGIIREYTWHESGFLGDVYLRCKDLYLLRDNMGFAISFCAEDKQWQLFENVVGEMINSFKFISNE